MTKVYRALKREATASTVQKCHCVM